jgi:signal peptidase II
MTASTTNGRVYWSAAVVVLALDFATKLLAQAKLIEHMPRQVIGNVVRFTLAYNPGAAFSMSLGQNSRYIFGAFAFVAIAILYRLMRATRGTDVPRALALGLASGGAAGNLLDRFREPRGVVDFIDVGVGDVRFWTFNVADSAVTVGALMLAFVLWQEDRRVLAEQAGAAAALDNQASAPEPSVSETEPS